MRLLTARDRDHVVVEAFYPRHRLQRKDLGVLALECAVLRTARALTASDVRERRANCERTPQQSGPGRGYRGMLSNAVQTPLRLEKPISTGFAAHLFDGGPAAHDWLPAPGPCGTRGALVLSPAHAPCGTHADFGSLSQHSLSSTAAGPPGLPPDSAASSRGH